MSSSFCGMEVFDWDVLRAPLPRVRSGTHDEVLDQVQVCNWCRHPVRIRGVVTEDADARYVVRAGLIGGKGIDESVAFHPAVLGCR